MTSPAEPPYPIAHHRWRAIVVFLALVVLAIVAVLIYLRLRGRPGCTTCPPSSLRPANKCAKRGLATNDLPTNDLPTNDLPTNDLPTNDLPTNDLPTNGLSAQSLEDNAELFKALADRALSEDVLTGGPAGAASLAGLLKQEHAADLVQYIASCALDPCEHVAIPDGDDFAHLRRRFPDGFSGGLGLCSGSYNAWAAKHASASEASWRQGAASAACRERVSSCMLARVNAVEARVPISMRGDGLGLLAKVPVQTQFRENHGTPIQSFKRCDRMCLWGDRERRNCDWEPRSVGQCVRGPDGAAPRRVRLAVEPAGGVRVRICKGIYGCDDTEEPLGAGAATEPVFAHGRLVAFPMHYGGQRIPHDQRGATIEFDCPDNGPKTEKTGERTGYYSVMVGSSEPGVPIAERTDVGLLAGATGDHDVYPAPESKVFTYREGAFYGSLFQPPPAAQPVAKQPEACPGSPPGPQYACASDIWKPAAARVADRLCAGPPGLVLSRGCFANTPGLCDPPAAAPRCVPEPALLAPATGYDTCTDTSPSSATWERPYTVYLNHPCDLFATDEECRGHLMPKVAGEAAVRPLYTAPVTSPPPIFKEESHVDGARRRPRDD